ncbi:MAG: ATP-dependent Clp protease ATP-binding subunit [Clostridia bacterium]|jgi:ATP-dependent Clp protease ATP-binding subunit ClpC|nr:ATP-dependent Clp protease ATP-binding subunit [Clostridiaceae bacterium]
MYGNFSEKADKSIKLSNMIATKFGHDQIATEHLLYGLVAEETGLAAKVLAKQNVTSQAVEEGIKRFVGYGLNPGKPVSGYSPRAKRILEMSSREAKKMNMEYIGTEHILLALVKEGDTVAVRILLDLNVQPKILVKDLIEMMKSGEGEGEVKETKTLEKYGRDLTKMAKEGKFDPVIGRENELQRVIQILSRRTKNNPCLVGEPGVGKTAIAELLAQRIADGDIPEILKDKRVISLDLSAMVAGSKYRGEFEERVKNALDEITKSGDIILFIDEIHTIIGAGAAEGSIDASSILKPSLARGEIQVVGATTLDEYRKHIEKDAALERRFQPVMVGEPSEEATIAILKGLRDRYEAHHGVKITDEAIYAAVRLSVRYLTDRYLPDKAIDLIDEACSKVRLASYTTPPELKELEEKLAKLENRKNEAISCQEYEKAAEIRDSEKALREQIEVIRNNWRESTRQTNGTVGEEEIAECVSQWTGVPVRRLDKEESKRLLDLENILHQRVVGQEEAVISLAKAIRRGRTGLKDPKRPVGSFIFLGPTGVGKTELSKALAEALFDNENAMIRVDMSEYMDKFNVSKLIGSPPGYVGYDEGGQLTEKVRTNPYSVVLFDEIEKAHPDVFNVLLQILDDGRITDSQGRTVDFRNTVIIMTSNVGAMQLAEERQLGFTSRQDNAQSDYKALKNKVMSELKRTFRPEFLNRVDDIIVFHHLTKEHMNDIIEIMLKDLRKRLSSKNITLSVTDKAKSYLIEKGYDKAYGARPLKRVIQNLIEDGLAEKMLLKEISDNDCVTVDLEGNELVFRKQSVAEKV